MRNSSINELIRITMVVLTVLGSALLVASALADPQGSQYSPPPATDTSSSCAEAPSRLYLQDGPHDNHFYSDCHSSVHVIVTSPRPNDDLNVVKPRLLV